MPRASALLVLLLVAAAVLVPASTAAGPVLLGDTAVEATADSDAAGTAEAFRTTAATAGTVVSLTVYVDAGSTATTLVAGLYADASGHPGALLGSGSLAAPASASWNTVTLPSAPAVTAGGT